jgi:hypothetical protein
MIRIRGFRPEHMAVVRRSLAVILQRLEHPPGPMPSDLRAELKAILGGSRPVVDVVYGGEGGICAEPCARSAGYRVVLCKRAFDQTRLPAGLFHELVHIARGWELDAEAFENAWFTRAEGAAPPTKDDWAIFRAQRYQGWWVQLNPRTGRVMDYADRLILTFPPPGRSRRRIG